VEQKNMYNDSDSSDDDTDDDDDDASSTRASPPSPPLEIINDEDLGYNTWFQNNRKRLDNYWNNSYQATLYFWIGGRQCFLRCTVVNQNNSHCATIIYNDDITTEFKFATLQCNPLTILHESWGIWHRKRPRDHDDADDEEMPDEITVFWSALIEPYSRHLHCRVFDLGVSRQPHERFLARLDFYDRTLPTRHCFFVSNTDALDGLQRHLRHQDVLDPLKDNR